MFLIHDASFLKGYIRKFIVKPHVDCRVDWMLTGCWLDVDWMLTDVDCQLDQPNTVKNVSLYLTAPGVQTRARAFWR